MLELADRDTAVTPEPNEMPVDAWPGLVSTLVAAVKSAAGSFPAGGLVTSDTVTDTAVLGPTLVKPAGTVIVTLLAGVATLRVDGVTPPSR